MGIDAPLVFILAVVTTYTLFPSSFVRQFLFFQEVDAVTQTVEKSWNDLYFLFFWIMAFTFLRAAVMTHVLMPLARRWGATSERTVVRFAEQGWICLYYSCSWSLGMVSVDHVLREILAKQQWGRPKGGAVFCFFGPEWA